MNNRGLYKTIEIFWIVLYKIRDKIYSQPEEVLNYFWKKGISFLKIQIKIFVKRIKNRPSFFLSFRFF